MDVRPLSAEHVAPLEAFFRRVPESDHNSFAEDVLKPGIVERWLSDSRPRRAVAVEGDDVVGYVAVLPLHGWSSHVGSLRVVTDPEVRGKGVGRALSRFEGLGFEPEALLRDHVRDKSGELHDLVVLAHLVEGTWSGMATAGLEDALTTGA
jgi:GNAT superfamily N-acetyltransferase